MHWKIEKERERERQVSIQPLAQHQLPSGSVIHSVPISSSNCSSSNKTNKWEHVFIYGCWCVHQYIYALIKSFITQLHVTDKEIERRVIYSIQNSNFYFSSRTPTHESSLVCPQISAVRDRYLFGSHPKTHPDNDRFELEQFCEIKLYRPINSVD